ncbi:MAG TPA: ROK family protein [Exilispira sp.]|nr:ROK family protein [Exilispira sp.]HPO61015.1 ROK family protein [Exilispira sp.]
MTKKYLIGIDIGGTNTKLGLFQIQLLRSGINENSNYLSKDNNIIYIIEHNNLFEFKNLSNTIFSSLKDRKELDREYFETSLVAKIDKFISDFEITSGDLLAISVATPGFPDNVRKVIISGSPNLPFLVDINFVKLFERFQHNRNDFCKRDILLDLVNDVTAQCFYEQKINKSLFVEDDGPALLLALGTGIGGGIFSKDEVFMGKNGWAAEFGHIPIYFSQMKGEVRKCNCGKENCSEVFGSVNAYAKELKNRSISLSPEDALEIYMKIISLKADPGNKDESVIFEITRKWIEAVSSLCGSLINTFNPAYIVFSGAICQKTFLIDILSENTKKYCFSSFYQEVKFLKSENPKFAGAFGAAIFILKKEVDTIIKYL